MGLHNFIDVAGIHIGVPDRFRIDHGHRARRAAIEATGLVHAHLARTGQAGRLDQRLAAVKSLLRLVTGTACLALLAFVEAKKDMPLVIGGGFVLTHARILGMF